MDFLAKGGVLVYPILICSVLALAIFVERLITFRRMWKDASGIEAEVADLVSRGETDKALDLAAANDSPLGRVLFQALDTRDADREMLETVIVNATDEEIRTHDRYMQSLATIGNIAPLLGLLGTVIGLIKAFMVIQELGGKVNAAVLAGGIWEAMLTTALGLAVALPTMIGHSYLLARVDRYEARLTSGSVSLLKAMTATGTASPAAELKPVRQAALSRS